MFINVLKSLSEGFLVTFEIFALTLAFAIPLGLIITFGSTCKAKAVSWPIKTFIWIIRGTPLMLQLIAIFYGPGLLATSAELAIAAGSDNFILNWVATWSVPNEFVAVIIAFSINYACYFSEIYRGGIESIPKGQYEACQVLGMTKAQTFSKVILVQVIKRILPPMSNEIITLVKDTSLARIIMVYEIIWSAQSFIKTDGILWPLFFSAVYYLVFNGILTLLFNKLEKKLNYFRG